MRLAAAVTAAGTALNVTPGPAPKPLPKIWTSVSTRPLPGRTSEMPMAPGMPVASKRSMRRMLPTASYV